MQNSLLPRRKSDASQRLCAQFGKSSRQMRYREKFSSLPTDEISNSIWGQARLAIAARDENARSSQGQEQDTY